MVFVVSLLSMQILRDLLAEAFSLTKIVLQYNSTDDTKTIQESGPRGANFQSDSCQWLAKVNVTLCQIPFTNNFLRPFVQCLNLVCGHLAPSIDHSIFPRHSRSAHQHRNLQQLRAKPCSRAIRDETMPLEEVLSSSAYDQDEHEEPSF